MPKNSTSVKIFLLALLLALSCNALPVCASVSDLTEVIPDDYLGNEFAWAMVLDLPDSKQIMHYSGSKIWPLTQVRVDWKTLQLNAGQVTSSTPVVYEEFWYHDRLAVGLRRHNNIQLAKNSKGAILVAPGDGNPDLAKRAYAIAGVVVRLLVDVQLRGGITGMVLVPADEFDNVADALSNYQFAAVDENVVPRGMSFFLRSYPDGEEDLFAHQSQ